VAETAYASLVSGAGWKNGEGNAWENQAMFDFSGKILPSPDVTKTIKTIQGRALFASSGFCAISDAAVFMHAPYSTLRTSLTSFMIAALGCAPTAMCGTSFIGMKSRLGMLWMPNAAATSLCSSTLTL